MRQSWHQVVGRDGSLSTPAAIAAVVAGGALTAWSGQTFSPTPAHPRISRWYRRLDKPGFTPPDAAFGAAWGAIEMILAYGGYRLLRKPSSGKRNLAVSLWALNTALIAGWSGLFFGRRDLKASTLAAGGMIAAATGHSLAASRTDKVAAITAFPLVGWLTFATLLAEEVWRRND